MFKHFIPLLMLMLFVVTPTDAQLNDFTLNWTQSSLTAGYQSGTAVVTPQEVTMTSVAGQNETLLYTPCSIGGDFDVQIDFALLNWPTGNGYSLGLIAVGADREYFSMSVLSDPQLGEVYQIGYSDNFPAQPLGGFGMEGFRDTFGKLRLVRSGSSVQFYVYSEFGDPAFGIPAGTWYLVSPQIVSQPPATSVGAPLFFDLELFPSLTSNAAAGVQVAFSDFRVNSGAVSCPATVGLGLPSTNNPVGMTNEPISTANGNYYNQHADLTLPGRGGPLILQRTYNSLSNYAGPLGAKWTDGLNIVLAQNTNGNVVIQWGDGHFETYTAGTSGFTPQPGVFSTLTKNTDGSFDLVTKDNRTFHFDLTGQLTSIQDRSGNMTVLAYNSGGLLQSATAPGGESLTFSYDSSNRITQVTDPIGRTVKYSYDPANDLAWVIDPAGGITTYTYNSSHRLLSETLPIGNILLQNAYDSSGRVIAQTNGRGFTTALAYDTPANGQTTITDPLGNQTIHAYDSAMRIAQITDPLGKSVSFTYDQNNDRTSVTNQNGATTSFTYDTDGNVTSITGATGRTTAFSYDAKNNLLTATSPNGNETSFTYDSNSNLAKVKDARGDVTTFAYDQYGQVASKTDARGNMTTYAHDSVGDLTQVKDPLGHIATLTYDGIGRLTSIMDPDGHTASAAYDALSRLVRVTDPLGNQTQFAYDPVGNLLSIVDADGHVTHYAYDATDNLTAVTDALGHVTKYSYDGNNNRIGFSDAKGNTTSYTYDALNRLSEITDPLSLVTAYTYDPVGNVTSITDAKKQTNDFAYDALNRLISISYADGQSVLYSYDADGNRLSMTDSHGKTTYAYDALDRLVSVTDAKAKAVAYGYDVDGNRQSLTYPDGKVVNYSYDPLNRLSEVTDWLGRDTAYSYDPAGNLLRTTYPNGASSDLTYDAANRLIEIVNSLRNLPPITLTYALDGVGNRTSFAVDGIATKYSYDRINELIEAQLGPLDSTWSYDAVGNRIEASSLYGPIDYSYDADNRMLTAGRAMFTYDADGNLTSVTRPRKGPLVYSYDAANRLVRVEGNDIDSAFAYDGDGNRIDQSVQNGTYQYLNDVGTALPVVLQESGPDGNISYAYGLRRISETTANFDYFYQYDGLGSVVTLSDASGLPAAGYLYDAWGNALLDIPNRAGTRNKFRFTGEALDPGTHLYYLRARYYDPTIGRFIAADPFPGFVRAPESLNRFGYVLGNPVRFADPSGLSAIEAQTSGQSGSTNAPYLASLGLSSNANSSLLAGPIFQFSSLLPPPGPAFQKAAGEFLLNVGLGSFFDLGKNTLIASYDLATQPVSTAELLQQGTTLTESVATFLTNRTVGMILGGINLLVVPEVAQAPTAKP